MSEHPIPLPERVNILYHTLSSLIWGFSQVRSILAGRPTFKSWAYPSDDPRWKEWLVETGNVLRLDEILAVQPAQLDAAHAIFVQDDVQQSLTAAQPSGAIRVGNRSETSYVMLALKIANCEIEAMPGKPMLDLLKHHPAILGMITQGMATSRLDLSKKTKYVLLEGDEFRLLGDGLLAEGLRIIKYINADIPSIGSGAQVVPSMTVDVPKKKPRLPKIDELLVQARDFVNRVVVEEGRVPKHCEIYDCLGISKSSYERKLRKDRDFKQILKDAEMRRPGNPTRDPIEDYKNKIEVWHSHGDEDDIEDEGQIER